MTSFLNRLFKYRAREKREPLEDFLSEVLCELINRLPVQQANNFVSECFIPNNLHEQYSFITHNRRLTARTQVRITGNRCLDVLIEIENQPIIIIENKIWAAFQVHQRLDEPDRGNEDNETENEETKEEKEIKYDHQLVTYGNWLAKVSKPDNWPGVLCVLTHAAQPPHDFVPSNTARYGGVPHLQFWRNLHGVVKSIFESDNEDRGFLTSKFIGQELCRFLEVKSMDSSDFSSIDISSINVSMVPFRKLNAVFSEVGAELLQRFPDKFIRRGQSNVIELENSRVWGWTYFQDSGKMYLGYGIYFAPITGQFSAAVPPLSDQEQTFLVVGSDGHAMNEGEDGLPNGWSRLGEETWLFVKPFPLSDRQVGERFPQFIVRLVQENYADINSILEKDLEIHAATAAAGS